MRATTTIITLALTAVLAAGCGGATTDKATSEAPTAAPAHAPAPTPKTTDKSDRGLVLTDRMAARMERLRKLTERGQRQAAEGDAAGMCETVARIQALVAANRPDMEELQSPELRQPGTEDELAAVVKTGEAVEEQAAVIAQASQAVC